MWRIARNLATDWYRCQRHEDIPTPDAALNLRLDNAKSTSMDLAVEALLDAQVAGRALEDLPEDQREAVVLSHFHDWTYAEMSDALGASVPALKMRVHRGLQALRELMGPE